MTERTREAIVREVTTHGVTRDGNVRRTLHLDTIDGHAAGVLRVRDNSDASSTAANLRAGELVTLHLTAHGTVWRIDRAESWEPAEAYVLRATARRLFSGHGHDASDVDPLTRENCGACALAGYGDADDLDVRGGVVAPNRAGWERLYLQASRPIPTRYRRAFFAGLAETDGGDALTPYARAMRRDLATFGVIWDAR